MLKIKDYVRGEALEQEIFLKSGVQTTELAHFRKFNALQGYLEKYPEYEENSIKLTEELLNDLLNRVTIILNDKEIETCSKELPTTSGENYGSLEYNESYFERLEELQDLIPQIKKQLEQLKENEDIIYRRL